MENSDQFYLVFPTSLTSKPFYHEHFINWLQVLQDQPNNDHGWFY